MFEWFRKAKAKAKVQDVPEVGSIWDYTLGNPYLFKRVKILSYKQSPSGDYWVETILLNKDGTETDKDTDTDTYKYLKELYTKTSLV